jgi:hypothetical protein
MAKLTRKGKKPPPGPRMPSLTIEGKREIINMALGAVGEDELVKWLNERGIQTIREIYEQVRKHKAKFFRDLFALSVGQ